jgi:hypothetical protein
MRKWDLIIQQLRPIVEDPFEESMLHGYSRKPPIA